MSQSYFSRIENGKAIPSPEVIGKLERVLKVKDLNKMIATSSSKSAKTPKQ